jgi:hypothetical protein
MTLTKAEQVETLEQIVILMDEIAAMLHSLGDRRLEVYCLAEFEGSAEGHWLGQFARDLIEERLADLRGDQP